MFEDFEDRSGLMGYVAKFRAAVHECQLLKLCVESRDVCVRIAFNAEEALDEDESP